MNDQLKRKKATYHLYTFTISKLISAFGAQIYTFAISFYILQLTGSAASFAANLICNIFPRILAAPFAGNMADKYSRKKIIILSQIGTTITIGGLLAVILTSGLSLVSIYVTTCILSLASTFSSVTFTSSITGLVDKDRIQKAMSFNQMSISIASVASPAAGGLIYGAVSMPVFLIIYIGASAVAAILEATMDFNLFANRTQSVEGSQNESMWKGIKAGINYVKLQPVVITLIWIALLVNFFIGAFEVGYSFILIEKLKMASQDFGVTQGAFAIGMFIMSIYFSIRNEVKFPLLVSKRGIIGMGIIMGSMGLPLMIKMGTEVVLSYYIILMLSFGAMVLIVNTPIQVMLQKEIEDDYKGRVFSIIETMAMALMPLGMVLFGILYDIFPAQWILLTSAVLLISVVLVLARCSVIRKVHPEPNQVTGTTEVL